ncbi:MAG: asparagine--tRNA ligase [Lachnospiraceae bacterium]|jgi:asparaginyl-tRNA synthetase|nr:asparagine--tRNA ligase [Lachnospiraceae bacterium]
MEQLTGKMFYDMYQILDGKEVTVSGWVKTKRIGKEVAFLEVSDGTYLKPIQVVASGSLLAELDFGVGSCVAVTGDLACTPEAKQPFEIKAKVIHVYGGADSAYPIQKKRHSSEFLRTIPHLRPRTNLYASVFRVYSVMMRGITKFLDEEGFVQIHTPIMTSCDGEGAGEVFRLKTEKFYGKESYLAVTGQLHLEAFALSLRKVYDFCPSFRAEDSNTTRHLAEFWQVEPEIAFCTLEDLIHFVESFCKSVISYCLKEAAEEMTFFDRFVEPGLLEKLRGTISQPFARISHKEAMELLAKSGEAFESPVYPGAPLQTEHERYLADVIFGRPVFVTDYPKEQKAFYMYQNPDGETVAATDLLFPQIGEIVGGSQREDRLERLQDRIRECGLCEEDYGWYLDLRRYGSAPHSGFGMGTERLMRYITGVENIRDVVPYPRTPGGIAF